MGLTDRFRGAVRAVRVSVVDLTVLLGLVLVIGLGTTAWNFGREYSQVDYFQFWAVGRLAGTGVTDIYSDSARKFWADRFRASPNITRSPRAAYAASRWPVLETYSSPFLYAAIGAFSTGDYELDSGLWQLLRIGALLAAALALCRLFGYTCGPRRS